MSTRTSVAAALAVALLSVPARAGVRLEVSGTARGGTALRIRAVNHGDVGATGVRPEAAYQRQTIGGDQVEIAAGASHEWVLPLPAATGPGTFPVVVRIRYRTDAGRASIPLVVLAEVPAAAPPAVDVALSAFPAAGIARARLQVQSRSARALAGRVVFVVPDGLSAEPESEPVQLAPGETRIVPVTLRGVAADARYPVSALFEYEEDGVHHAALATAELAPDGSAPGRMRPLAIGALALGFTLLLLGLAWRRAAARQRPV